MNLGLKPKNLLDVLIDQGKIKAGEAQAWHSLSNTDLEKVLRQNHKVNPEDLARAYAAVYSLPYVSLKGLTISPEAIQAIPEKVARELKIISYEFASRTLGGKVLKIAVADPAELSGNIKEKIADLEKKKGIKIDLSVTNLDDYGLALSQYATSHQKMAADAAEVETEIPRIDLRRIIIPYDTVSKFPEDIARKYKMVVFGSPHPQLIKVAVADPNDLKVKELLSFIKEKNHIAIEEYKAAPDDVLGALKYYNEPLPRPKEETEKEDEEVTFEPTGPLSNELPGSKTPLPTKNIIPEVMSPTEVKPLVLPQNNLDNFLGTAVQSVEDLESVAQENNVPKTLAAIVALAAFKKASDIHIEPTEENLRVRYRIDGILKDVIKLPLEIHPAVISRVKILSSLKIDENRIPQDGRFDVITGGHAIDFRVSTLPTVHGEKVALRILDKSARIYTMEELGLAGRNLKILTENIDKPYGTILATGPTGSGKSTTLYAILSRIATASINVVTIEDPVEYEIPGINQCQIKPKIGFTFANGLRSILRQDPNVIMVGEIRDSETAALAINAALTGHLVLSTLHTNDAPGALLRLINMGIEPFLITSSVNVILAQRLVRKLCPKCKTQAHIPQPILKTIEQELTGFNLQKPYRFFEGRGCDQCEQGYKGRIGIFEVMPMTEEIETLASQRKQSSEIKATAIRNGMTTMKQDGLIKALKGLTTVNEVLRVISV
ncbi:MAG: type II/IV secretion system protein [Patescibacteria group bacterium]